MSKQIVISTAGKKGLPAVLIADRENVVALIAMSDRGAEIFFEKLYTLDAHLKASLVDALTAAADLVVADITSSCVFPLPESRYVRSSLYARLRGSLRRLLSNRRHILELAHAGEDGAGLFVGLRTIDAGIEVIFEDTLLELLLNANGKTSLAEALRRAAYAVQCRGARVSGAA